MARSIARRWPSSTIDAARRGTASLPTRKRATSSIGFCVADRPMRWSRARSDRCSRRTAASSRSSVSARCAPRRVPITAWISSTMTVRAVRSICRLRSAVSSRYSDSGVVTRMCGGVRSIAARSDDVVSPVRTAAVMRGTSTPGRFRRAAGWRVAARPGSCGCRRSAPSAARRRRRAPRPGSGDSSAFAHEIVDRRQKRGERLARAGRRGDQRVAARPDRLPPAPLRGRRLSDRFEEPLRNERMETGGIMTGVVQGNLDSSGSAPRVVRHYNGRTLTLADLMSNPSSRTHARVRRHCLAPRAVAEVSNRGSSAHAWRRTESVGAGTKNRGPQAGPLGHLAVAGAAVST